MRLALTLPVIKGPVLLIVLWALGWSMVALGFLCRLPIRVLAAGSILVILLHNLADPVTAQSLGAAGPLWKILHQVGPIPLGGVTVIVAYPLIPWIAVMSAGFCFGPVLRLEPRERRAWMVRIGVGMILAFVALRASNIYGDPVPWSSEIPGRTWLSFLRCTKNPPSLDFLLMTLGPALLILAWFDRLNFSAAGRSAMNPLLVFGRVPLFYFVVHFVLIRLLTIPLADFLVNPLPTAGGDSKLNPPAFGFGLAAVYGLWLLVVVLMYPLCLWFCRLKARRRDWWLSYI